MLLANALNMIMKKVMYKVLDLDVQYVMMATQFILTPLQIQ